MNHCGLAFVKYKDNRRIIFLYNDLEIFCLDDLNDWESYNIGWGIHKWVYDSSDVNRSIGSMLDLIESDGDYTIITDGVDEI